MDKITKLLKMRSGRRSYREIAHNLNISVGAVSEYLKRAKKAGLSWPLPEDMSEQDLYLTLFPKPYSDKLVPDWEYIHKELRKKGVTRELLWKEHLDTHPEAALSYSQFCRDYREFKSGLMCVMRQNHKAGEKTFVDYSGLTMSWKDLETGAIHKAEVFVGCLGASQYIFVEATPSQKMSDWIQSHIHMFEFFGGVTTMLVPDNLKSGVKKAHLYDPEINLNYQNMGEHYGVAIVPARAVKPKDKSKVESAVQCVERHIMAPLRNRTFYSLGEVNAALKKGMENLNNKRFQKMATSRRELFETLDKPALKPLPQDRYQYAEWKKAKVGPDYHIQFDFHFYSCPYQYMRKEVWIRATSHTVECFYQDKRIAVHERRFSKYAHSTLSEHRPEAHRIQEKESAPDWIKQQAKQIGPNTEAFIQKMIAARAFPEQAYRSCLGVVRLAKTYTPERLENACKRAIHLGITRYQSVVLMLKNGLEDIQEPQPPPTPIIEHDNVRGPEYYNTVTNDVQSMPHPTH